MKLIRVFDNQGQEYQYPLEAAVAEVTIGRSQSNDIILGSKTVSRRHAILKVTQDRVMLVNQSPNGVMVGTERVEHVRELAPGEFVQIDTFRLCVEVPGAPAPAHGQPAYGQPAYPPPAQPSQPVLTQPVHAISAQPAQPARPSPQRAGGGEKSAERLFDDFMEQMFPSDAGDPRVNLSGNVVQNMNRKSRRRMVEFKSRVHETLKDRLDLHSFEITDYRDRKSVV